MTTCEISSFWSVMPLMKEGKQGVEGGGRDAADRHRTWQLKLWDLHHLGKSKSENRH